MGPGGGGGAVSSRKRSRSRASGRSVHWRVQTAKRSSVWREGGQEPLKELSLLLGPQLLVEEAQKIAHNKMRRLVLATGKHPGWKISLHGRKKDAPGSLEVDSSSA